MTMFDTEIREEVALDMLEPWRKAAEQRPEAELPNGSAAAAVLGAGIGSAIGAAIAEGHLRRVNRRTCLLTKGWRLVDVWPVEAARLATMTEAERDTYFNSIVGAQEVKGEVTIWTNDFAAPRLAPESAQ